jgi:hypothetical protein
MTLTHHNPIQILGVYYMGRIKKTIDLAYKQQNAKNKIKSVEINFAPH